MKFRKLISFLPLVVFGGVVVAAENAPSPAPPLPTPAEERAALAVLEAKGTARVLERNVEEMINRQCAAAPEMAPYRSVLERVYREYFGFDALKADLIRYYLSKFSPAELDELARFYASPIGRKLVAAEFDLVPVTVELMLRQSKAMLPKLQQELESAQRKR